MSKKADPAFSSKGFTNWKNAVERFERHQNSQSHHHAFSIIIDGTQDITGREQESICFRYVDEDLVPHEVFVGLYEVSGTTGVEIARTAVDVLLRLNLPMSCLRGQTYDGAVNMSGAYSGAQAEVKKQQPLALYVHCGPHCLNLITQAACQASSVIRDALEWVHDLGSLCKQSGRFKAMFSAVAADSEEPSVSLRTLCPTRWTVRGTAIKAVLSQYDSILTSLQEMAAAGSSTSARANGMHERFEKGRTVLGLLMALEVTEELECLNKSLQKLTATIAGMRCSIECFTSTQQLKRNEERFHQMFDKAAKMVNSLGIEPIQIPHQRRPPKRYVGGASQHTPKSPEEHYRAEFYKVLDSVDVQFQERFNQPDLGVLQKLEEILLTGEVDGIIDRYPEINRQSKVIPVSSAEAERSFSALRRLKTWLRSTMTQMRLNNAAHPGQ
nr:PREDICTED: zinc finger MYM-type protein 1-like [Pundamilia nyererei]